MAVEDPQIPDPLIERWTAICKRAGLMEKAAKENTRSVIPLMIESLSSNDNIKGEYYEPDAWGYPLAAVAIKALVEIGALEAIPQISKLRDHVHREIRHEAKVALVKLGALRISELRETAAGNEEKLKEFLGLCFSTGEFDELIKLAVQGDVSQDIQQRALSCALGLLNHGEIEADRRTDGVRILYANGVRVCNCFGTYLECSTWIPCWVFCLYYQLK
jgi:hypothetical protein